MSTTLDTNSPLNYTNWLKHQIGLNPDASVFLYTEYLKEWYSNNKTNKSNFSDQIKKDYIQLLKDLSFLFETGEKDIFLSQIDYTKDEDIILAIPYFVQKLKDVCKDITYKRETLKNSKIKYNLVGSNEGLETILYEYILKNFTNNGSTTTEIPISLISNSFPALSSVNQNFFIEIEELHDSQSYHDSDPSVSINQYLNVNNLLNDVPFEGMTENEVYSILSTRYLSRVANTPLSQIFKQYLSEIPMLSTASLSASQYQLISDELIASQKYLGETVYGLTAIRLSDVYKNNPDYILNLSFNKGNNWFFWPSGNKIVNNLAYNNVYAPIEINNSNFVNSGATGGDDYTNSDLLFINKNGYVEGAWLQGPRIDTAHDVLSARFFAGQVKEFIYPFVGFNITPKGTQFGGFNLNDDSFNIFEKLNLQQKQNILTQYYTTPLPAVSANDIYLNDSNLVINGAYAGLFSDDADTIIKQQNNQAILPVYNPKENLESAYLYKFLNTDFPIDIGISDIKWPIGVFNAASAIPITPLEDTCLPINLSNTNPKKTVLGAIAGRDFNVSDVIYKLNTRTGQPMEAAWLGSGPISNLIISNTINVYNTSAVYCASYTDGDVQSSLSTQINSSGFISFVWCDQDTYADEVFFYRNHAEDCPYLKTSPHDYYSDQDYQNPQPIMRDSTPWTKCRCKSVYYSPIGHGGKILTDYNGITDYLFADPQGLGVDFALNTWVDTRGYNPLNSPQFSFYKLDGNVGDKKVGWGSGFWKTGSGSRMVLKTGKRYTYYRTPLRSDNGYVTNNKTPYLIVNYPYKNVKGFYSLSNAAAVDLVIVIDISYSERLFDLIGLIKEFIKNLSNNNANNKIQVSIISFAYTPTINSYLTNNLKGLEFSLFDINLPNKFPDYTTDIVSALKLAESVLNTTIQTKKEISIFTDLCSQLNATIQKLGSHSTQNNIPNPNAKKSILIFSDGYETINIGDAVPYAQELKNKGIEINSVAIGPNSYYTNNMKLLASDERYFNLQEYLNGGDGDNFDFIQYLTASLNGGLSIIPMWYKAIRDLNGNWFGITTYSDMILRPGDYLSYVHRSHISYTGAVAQTSFILPAISFAANFKLDGWNYSTNTFSTTGIGISFGAKPFWAKSYTVPQGADQHFDKPLSIFGGQIRFINDYVPIHQPEISDMVLTNGCYLEYTRNTTSDFMWVQPLTLSIYNSSYSWNKIYFKETVSNLEDVLRVSNVNDLVAYSTDIPSQITLEDYSGFKPARYNYYARTPFSYKENLFYVDKCLDTFVVFNTAAVITPEAPYSNLDNVHFPTVASVSLPSLATTEKQTGGYLLPENLGTSFYRGRGYNIEVDGKNLSYIDGLSAERMFLDTNKFGPRNRGLTKKDQNTPVSITNIDNTWIYYPYVYGSAAGIIIDPLTNQKFTPYQTSYEITKINNFGLSRQSDSFEFWTNSNGYSYWNDNTNYPLTIRQELLASSYKNRQAGLLCNKGSMTNWKMDIFGNNYGLIKPINLNTNIPLPS